MEISSRVKMVINSECGGNQSIFSEKVDVPYTTCGNQLRTNNFTSKLLCGLLEAFPDIDANWLLMGEGEMYKSSANIMAEDTVVVSEPEPETETDEVTELKNQVKMLLQLLSDKNKQMSQLIDLLSNSEEIKKQRPA